MLQRVWFIAILVLVAVNSDVEAAGQPKQRGQATTGRGAAQAIKKLDTDGDGQLSKSEFDAARSKGTVRSKRKAGAARGKGFNRLDTNGDGLLSPAELKKLKELRNRRPGGAKSGARGSLPN
jgi:Ca2+-binding EF-hand superfamily protein